MDKILGLDLPTCWFLIVGAVFTGYVILDGFDLGAGALHPTLVPSTVGAQYTLTVYNSASTDPSLRAMLLFAAIGIPIVATYTIFVFWTFRGKVKMDENSYL